MYCDNKDSTVWYRAVVQSTSGKYLAVYPCALCSITTDQQVTMTLKGGGWVAFWNKQVVAYKFEDGAYTIIVKDEI